MPQTNADRPSAWGTVRKQPYAAPAPGADVEQPVTVTLEEAFHGTERWLSVTTPNQQECVVKLTIPPGVDNGTRVRFSGYGAPGRNESSPGNLYLVISVTPNQGFTRQDAHLYHRVSVPRSQLTLGGVVQVRALDDKTFSLTIPAGTTDGQRFRWVGQGMPLLGTPGQRGNLYVTVNDHLPHAAAATSAPNNTERKDTFGVIVFLVVIFLLGIGAGFLFYWLILN
jgi:DnaJ-class molecular chaperone